MNDAEEIQSAIYNLNRQKAKAEPGRWDHQPYGGQNQNGDHSGGSIFDGNGEYLISEVSDGAGELIETLHRTIDAQLALLRETLYQLSGGVNARGFLGNEYGLILRFARAINGVSK